MADSTSVPETGHGAHDSPQGGRVAYLDITGPLRTAGLAMTWAVPGEGVRWAAVIDRVVHGRVTWTGPLPEDGNVAKALMAGFTKLKDHSLPSDREVLSLMFPHENSPAAAQGLPPLAEHSRLARRAVERTLLPFSMQKALRACLAHGASKTIPVCRPNLGRSVVDWERFAFATEHPHFVQAVRGLDPALLDTDDTWEAISQKWPDLTEAHLRSLPERQPGHTGPGVVSGGKHEVSASITLMAAIPVDWMPNTEDVRGFNETASTVARLASLSTADLSPRSIFDRTPAAALPKSLDSLDNDTIYSLVTGAKGDWEMFALRMFRAADVDPDRADGFSLHLLADKCTDCKDAIQSLSETLLQPMLAWRDGPAATTAANRAAYALLYEGKSAPAVLETSSRWHLVQQRIQAELRRNAGKEGWPALFDGEFRHGDIAVVPVTDYDALSDEGARGRDRQGRAGLNHCVLSYLPRLLTGETHVLSVRKYDPDGSWHRVSTCQVSASQVPGRYPSVSVVQHRGPSNVDPTFEASQVVSRMRDQIQSGGLPMNPEALRNRGTALAACGYDWRNPEELANALAVWEPLLPRWARGLDPSEFLDALVEQEMIPRPRHEASARPRM